VWPAALVVGGTYGLAQLAISNLHGPWLAAIGPALISLVVLVGFLRVWKPAEIVTVNEAPLSRGDERLPDPPAEAGVIAPAQASAAAVRKAWVPWLILTALVFVWGIPAVKAALDAVFKLALPVPGLDLAISKVPPVVAQPTLRRRSIRSTPCRRPALPSSLPRCSAGCCSVSVRWRSCAAMAGHFVPCCHRC
jgi:lactate permease